MQTNLLPLAIGSDQQFRSLKEFLDRAGYTEAAVCKRAGIRAIFEFKTIHDGRSGNAEIHDTLDALIRLLMDGEVIPRTELVRFLDEDMVRTLSDLGVIETVRGDLVYAEVVLYPQEELYIVSDRTHRPDVAPQQLPADVVYASITNNTSRFLKLLPRDPCEALLDLCSGTGIAALLGAARYAQHAWACDLSGRATHFAEFNRRLNGLDNVTALEGDLYAPVTGRTFDRIVAHPPYVPAAESKVLFRDGGEDGEQIVRGIVTRLPEYLRPGGRCYIITVAADREGETFEQRVRTWIGHDNGEFDVLLALNMMATRPGGPANDVYSELKTTALLHGALVIERHAEPAAPVTARCTKALNTGGEVVEWFRAWHKAARLPEFRGSLLNARIRIVPALRLFVVHTVQDGVLAPMDFHMTTDFPLRSEANIQPWVAVLISACNGARTGFEVLRYLQDQETVSREFSEAEFAEVLERLGENGYIEFEGRELPETRRASA